ncbi:hypothetical protein WJX82_000006 [Trebouxia sp. C0006]
MSTANSVILLLLGRKLLQCKIKRETFCHRAEHCACNCTRYEQAPIQELAAAARSQLATLPAASCLDLWSDLRQTVSNSGELASLQLHAIMTRDFPPQYQPHLPSTPQL